MTHTQVAIVAHLSTKGRLGFLLMGLGFVAYIACCLRIVFRLLWRMTAAERPTYPSQGHNWISNEHGLMDRSGNLSGVHFVCALHHDIAMPNPNPTTIRCPTERPTNNKGTSCTNLAQKVDNGFNNEYRPHSSLVEGAAGWSADQTRETRIGESSKFFSLL